MKRALSAFMFALLLVSMLTMAFRIQPVRAEPKIWIVDDDGPADFTSIQEAVNAANPGDTVYVKNGTYYENVNVNKTISLIGESKENTIVDGGGVAAVIIIEKDSVLVAGFIVRNSGTGWYYDESSGIFINEASFCNISSNIATNIRYGISSWLGQNNTICHNIVSNAEQGISFNGPSYNTAISNSISDTSIGIGLWVNSYYSNVANNTISNSSDSGIRLDNSPHSLVTNNIIADSNCGIYLSQSALSTIYHNSFISNTQQVFLSDSLGTTWDDGYPSGGNHWSDYGGVDVYSGQSQNETGIDGIGDTSYVIDENNQDNYPLVNSWFLPWGDWEHYHSYMEILRVLLYLNETYPSIVDVFSIGKSWQNRDIYCIRLTNESNTHPKPQLFLVGYHHAREPISAELPLYFAVDAAANYGSNETITRMLNYSEIYIVPALNVDGFNAVKQNEWQRKNVHPYDEDGDYILDEDPPDDQNGDGHIATLIQGTPPWEGTTIGWEGTDNDGDGSFNEDWIGGVDINRNYGYQWNASCVSGSPYAWAEDYRGPEPFSEPETQAIRDLALSHDFKYALSLHSGTEVIGYPWGYTTDTTSDDLTFKQIASNLSALVGAPYGQSSYMYNMSGSWDDWMYQNRSTFALTCEIYANNSAWQFEPGPEPDTWWMKGIFQGFNPEPSQIEPVVQRWLPVFTYTTDRAIAEAYDTSLLTAQNMKTGCIPKPTVCGGMGTQIYVTIENQGDFQEVFNVTLYVNSTRIGERIVTVDSAQKAALTFWWETTSLAEYENYTISVQVTPVPGEVDVSDNNMTGGTVTVVHMGDVTGDGKVDIQDVARVSGAFGSLRVNDPDNPKYSQYWHPAPCPTCPHQPNTDINGDAKVDIQDLARTSGNFGWHRP